MCNDNNQSAIDTDMLGWQVKWHLGLLIIIMKLSCNIYVLYSSQSLLGIFLLKYCSPKNGTCFTILFCTQIPSSTNETTAHKKRSLTKLFRDIILPPISFPCTEGQTKSLNSNNDAICANLWITFQLKQTCCWQQFLDIFYCHMHSFCIYKVQQDFHGGGCQALDIHTGFIFLRELQIKRET